MKLHRVLLFLLLAVPMVVVLSCSKDDNVITPKTKAQLSKQLHPCKDNTIYEEGEFSNGAGYYLFTGENANGDMAPPDARRALIMFDIALDIPSGSTVDSVMLRLHLSRVYPASGDRTTSIHRVLADWGEGDSHAVNEEGTGAVARYSDATWVYAFHDSVMWATSGGHFTPIPSAQADVGVNYTYYTWKTPEMTADVQSWLDSPALNFGWIVIGDESVPATAKRFDSRQNVEPTFTPSLYVYYTAP